MSVLHDRRLIEADPTVRLTAVDRINILVPAIGDSNVDDTATDSGNSAATRNAGQTRPTRQHRTRQTP